MVKRIDVNFEGATFSNAAIALAELGELMAEIAAALTDDARVLDSIGEHARSSLLVARENDLGRLGDQCHVARQILRKGRLGG